jgi:hypothetical protein
LLIADYILILVLCADKDENIPIDPTGTSIDASRFIVASFAVILLADGSQREMIDDTLFL